MAGGRALLFSCISILLCVLPAQAWLDDILTFVEDAPFVQPGCTVMFAPGQFCFPHPAPFVKACCTPGFECVADPKALLGHSCQQAPAGQLSYAFESMYGKCTHKVVPGGQCGGGGGACKQHKQCANTGPWVDYCCPDGFSCQPSEGGTNFRIWACQPDVSDRRRPPDAREVLRYPPRPLPRDACACRSDEFGARVPAPCPSPWAAADATRAAPAPAIRIGARGRFAAADSGDDVVLKGVNWFGHNVGQYNVDGLWAYCDDNYTASDPPCAQDGEIPPYHPEPAIGADGVAALGGIKFWGKRALTNDFATVVHRMRLLGFNAVRLPFTFAELNDDLPGTASGGGGGSGGGAPEFFPCMRDDAAAVALRAIDPLLAARLKPGATFEAPAYTGPPHPPPPGLSPDPRCQLPWEAPFAPSYRGGQGSLQLTQCNWYLPQGRGTPAIQRFLWQVQYLVSQGFYVVLAFSSSRADEPNVERPSLLAANWRSLWRMLKDLPEYDKRLRGRVLADLANEPSRWGCRWDAPCAPPGAGKASCAAGVHLYAAAASAIHGVDPGVPVLVEGMGQEVQKGRFAACAAGAWPGMAWGEGFVTNGPALKRYNVSDPSGLFAYDDFKRVGPVTVTAPAPPNNVVLSPHLYPASITGADAALDADEGATVWRWDLSWGWKSLGLDRTSAGAPLRDVGLFVGEFGVFDFGDNAVNNTDTTAFAPADRRWLKLVSRYLNALSWQNGPASWMYWSWNANSGDTKGIVGPGTTWREVQWAKVRMLIREFGLVPWYCPAVDPEFCATVEW